MEGLGSSIDGFAVWRRGFGVLAEGYEVWRAPATGCAGLGASTARLQSLMTAEHTAAMSSSGLAVRRASFWISAAGGVGTDWKRRFLGTKTGPGAISSGQREVDGDREIGGIPRRRPSSSRKRHETVKLRVSQDALGGDTLNSHVPLAVGGTAPHQNALNRSRFWPPRPSHPSASL